MSPVLWTKQFTISNVPVRNFIHFWNKRHWKANLHESCHFLCDNFLSWHCFCDNWSSSHKNRSSNIWGITLSNKMNFNITSQLLLSQHHVQFKSHAVSMFPKMLVDLKSVWHNEQSVFEPTILSCLIHQNIKCSLQQWELVPITCIVYRHRDNIGVIPVSTWKQQQHDSRHILAFNLRWIRCILYFTLRLNWDLGHEKSAKRPLQHCQIGEGALILKCTGQWYRAGRLCTGSIQSKRPWWKAKRHCKSSQSAF